MPGGKKHPDLLTERETLFVRYFEGNVAKAAVAAGVAPGSAKQRGNEMMKRAPVVKAIAQKQAAMSRESGKRLGRLITRSEILEITAKVARSKATGAQAKIAAATLLAKIFGMIVNRTEDVTAKFAGWTEQEMEQFAITGIYPERIRSLQGTSGLPPGLGDPQEEPAASGIN